MVPKLDPTQLPDGAAALAVNCQVSGGVLVPAGTPSPLVELGPGDVSAADYGAVSAITAAPVVQARTKICRPFEAMGQDWEASDASAWAESNSWLRIQVWAWVTVIEQEGVYAGRQYVVGYNSRYCRVDDVRYTDSGMFLLVHVPSFDATNAQDLKAGFLKLAAGREYTVHGPIFSLQFKGEKTAFGGPELGINIPPNPHYGDSQLPAGRVALTFDGKLYGALEVVSVRTLDWTRSIDQTAAEMVRNESLWGEQTIWEIDLNYREPERLHRYYIACPVDGDNREGPPSPLSEEVIVDPGELVTMRMNNPTKLVNLYRSATGGDDFRLLEEKRSITSTVDGVAVTDYEDRLYAPLGDVLPVFGNDPGLVSDQIFWHPAGFAVGFQNLEDDGERGPRALIWQSDVYRGWSWPEEYTIPVPEQIQRLVMTGNGVLVFGTASVWAVVGSSPETGAARRLSSGHPLVNPRSLARLGDHVYYATREGLAEASTSGVRVVTGGHFDQATWIALGLAGEPGTLTDDGIASDDPRLTALAEVWAGYGETEAAITAAVGDGRLVYGPLVFDFEEESAAVTLRDGGGSRWVSKVFEFDQRTVLDFARFYGTGTVSVRFWTDGVVRGPFTLAQRHDPDWTPAPIAVWCRRLQFELTFTGRVTRFEAETRVVRDASDEMVLTSAEVVCWRNLWFRWLGRGNWCAGKLGMQRAGSGDGGYLVFTPQGGGDSVELLEAGNGVFYLPRDMQRASYWHVDLTPDAVDQLVLLRRVTEVVQGGVINEVYDGGVPPWRRKRYQFVGRGWPTAFSGESTLASFPLHVYVDGSVGPTLTVTVVPGTQVRLSGLGAVELLEVDFGGYDEEVRGWTLWAESARMVGGEGLQLGDGERYRGQLVKFLDRGRWALYSIWLDAYPATLRLYSDGAATPAISATVGNGNVGYLPWVSEAAQWEVDLDTTARVRGLALVPWTREAVEGSVLDITAQDLLFPPWRHTIWQWNETKELKSVWVDTDLPTVPIDLYLNGTHVAGVRINSHVETPLPSGLRGQNLRIVFRTDDSTVNRVRIHTSETVSVGPEGLHISDRLSWRMLSVRGLEAIEWACGVMHADEYAGLSVVLLRGGVEVGAGQPGSGAAFRVDHGVGAGYDWTIDVRRESAGVSVPVAARGLSLMPWRTVEVGAQFSALHRESGIPEWYNSEWTFDGQRVPSSVLVQGSQSVTLSVMVDGGAVVEIPVTPGVETPLTGVPRGHTMRLHFGADDDTVEQVTVWTEADVMVTGAFERTPEQGLRMVPVVFPDAGSWACGIVKAGVYPVTLSLLDAAGLPLTDPASGQALGPITVADGGVFRVPEHARYGRGYVDVVGTDVRSVVLLPWRREAVEGSVIFGMRAETGIPAWLHTIYDFTEERRVQLRSFRVESSALPVSLTVDVGVDSVTDVVNHYQEGVFATEPLAANAVRFHFNGNDGLVTEVRLFGETVIPIEQQGIVIRNGGQVRNWRRLTLLFAEAGRFVVARIAATETATLRLSCDGVPQGTWERKDNGKGVEDNAFELGYLDTGRTWTLDVECMGRIDEVHLVGDVAVPVGQGSVVLRRQQQPFSWLHQSIVSATPVAFSSARVVAQVYPVYLRLFAEGSAAPAVSQAISSSLAVRLPRKSALRGWVLSVTDVHGLAIDDSLISEVGVASSMARLRQ